MPEYDAFTLADVSAAIEAGQPTSLSAAADAFAAVVTALTDLGRGITTRVNDVTSAEAPWEGRAASAFVQLTKSFVERIDAVAGAVRPYESAIDTAAATLTSAQDVLARYKASVATALAGMSAEAATALAPEIDAGARGILAQLAGAYRTATAALRDLTDNTSGEVDPSAGPREDEPPSIDGPLVDPELASGIDPLFSIDTSSLLGDDPLAAGVPGLIPVDLGGGPQLSLGSIDPTTVLAGLDPLPSPSLVLGGSLPSGPLTSPALDTSLTGGGLFAPLFGRSPATHLTTATPPPTSPPAAPPAAGATRPPIFPMSPLGVGPLGGMPRPMAGRIGGAPVRPAEDDEDAERESTIVGDEEWNDDAGLSDAIGRDRPAQTARG